MNIAHTRNMVRAAIEGQLAGVETQPDPTFGLAVPVRVPGVPDEVLHPRETWADKVAFDRTARRLAAMFHLNFAKYADGVTDGVRAAGPKVHAADLQAVAEELAHADTDAPAG
jgi:phosphoenolpyruvate carboxykinase (ATP)